MSMWDTVNLGIALLSLIAACAIALFERARSRKVKSLDYSISVTEFSVDASSNDDRLTMMWDSVPIRKPLLVKLRMENTGSEVLTREDLGRPLQIRYDGRTAVVGGRSYDESHSEIVRSVTRPNGNLTESYIQLGPITPGQGFNVMYVLEKSDDHYNSTLELAYRLDGLTRKPGRIRESRGLLGRSEALVPALTGVVFLLVLLVLWLINDTGSTRLLVVVWAVLAIAAAVVAAVGSTRRRA